MTRREALAGMASSVTTEAEQLARIQDGLLDSQSTAAQTSSTGVGG